ncbi:hypothetical protein KC909_03910 [Candidatus Dojkabacteria bacterium]|uniref:Pyruvate kinase n=1 Tax=Candidatus Dojkabacteria bacterium TaxID=2099670 RepID=A0A955RJ13_9BACT|nr:hypothetical protein [Candidatus Dojkabacteria bacterium]
MYIVATISKNSYQADKIREILNAGATVLRYNFSHGTPEQMLEHISAARDVIADLKLEGKISIMADLPGMKIRLGKFSENRYISSNEIILFRAAKESPNYQEWIPIDYPTPGDMVKVGDIITHADGETALEVTKVIDSEQFEAKALNDRFLAPLKGINFRRKIDELEHFTAQTLEHIATLEDIKPEWVAFSFVNSKENLQRGIDLLKENLSYMPQIVTKIETPNGIANIEEIAELADVLLIARGDLGLYTPIEELYLNQTKIINAAKKYKKQAIVSTQILDSILEYYVPSRADVIDLSNAFMQGADGVMLTKETGISLTPGRSVEFALKVIERLQASGLNK